MPSSPEITILPSDALATGGATVTAWQPISLSDGAPSHSGAGAPSHGATGTLPHVVTGAAGTATLPRFERRERATAPTLRAFAVSPKAGIPEDLLAAETAAARASGYAAGYAAGIDEARTTTRERLAAQAAAAETSAAAAEATRERAFQSLFDAAEELEGLAVQSAADIEEQIVSAAWTIAEAIVGQVLADDDSRSQAALTRALSLAPSDEDVTVAVSPADFAVLAGHDEAARNHTESNHIAGNNHNAGSTHTAGSSADNACAATDMTPLRRSRGLRTVTIVADESLTPGDAVATCGATTIDARLSAAIERVRRVLAP
jgi:flagellar assembly protein FliH